MGLIMAHIKFEAKKVDDTWTVDMDADGLSVEELATLFGKIAAQAVVDFSENAEEFCEMNQGMVAGFFSGVTQVQATPHGGVNQS